MADKPAPNRTARAACFMPSSCTWTDAVDAILETGVDEVSQRDDRVVFVNSDRAADLRAAEAGRRWNARHRGRIPPSIERLRFWSVKAHQQVEFAFRCGKPVGFLVSTGTRVLEIEVK